MHTYKHTYKHTDGYALEAARLSCSSGLSCTEQPFKSKSLRALSEISRRANTMAPLFPPSDQQSDGEAKQTGIVVIQPSSKPILV